MAISWVAGTTASFVNSAASLASTTPAGIQDGDTLFAFVRTSSDVSMSPPAGWTQAAVAGAAGGAGYTKVWAFTKDTVTSGNSSTSYTWTPGSTAQISVTYAVVRASAGDVKASYTSLVGENTADGTVAFPSVTAGRNGSMLLLVGGSYWTSGGSTSTTLSNMSGATLWTGSVNINLLGGAYWPRNEGQGTGSATMTFLFGSATNNAEVGLVVSLYDTGIEVTSEDGVTFEPHTGEGNPHYGILADALTSGDTPATARPVSVADGLRHVDVPLRILLSTPVVAEGLDFAPTAAVFPRWGGVLTDRVALAPAQVANYKVAVLAADSTRLADLTRMASPVALSVGMNFAEAVTVAQAARVLEALALTSVAAGVARYGLTTLETLALGDALRRFFAAEATVTLGITPTTLEAIKRTALVSDTLVLAEALGHSLILRVTTTDEVDLTAVETLKMIFAPTVMDGVDLVAGYVAPNGSFTTWAVNTTTAAVTEYTGFEFNSFARLGRRYLAATSEGLYVLDGDTDDGADIIADIKTGAARFAGSRFSSVKAVYLGLRGNGEFRLKIIDGEGAERTYKVITQSARTAKVQTGKGIRTRYLAFELVSTGQDFDLDTIEIIPLLAQRRV